MKTKKRSADDLLDEIHAVRRKLDQEMEGMNIQERIAYIHAKTAPVIKEYGMKVVAHA